MTGAVVLGIISAALVAAAVRPAFAEPKLYLVPDGQYPTVQSAIDVASSGDTVRIKKDRTYAETVTLKNGVTVEGEQAVTTVLTGGVTGASGGILQKVRIETLGVTASSVSDLTIRNNIFRSIPGTALSVHNSSGSDLSNNTFFGNGTAVSATGPSGSGTASGKLVANIFVENNTAIAAATGVSTVSRNHFFDNGNDDNAAAIKGTDASSGDPLFVATPAGDFHLKAGSPCIDADPTLRDLDGTPADLGAYGGVAADPVPVAVSGVAATQTAADTVRVSWSANLAYDVDGYIISTTPLQDGSGLPDIAADADQTQVDATVVPPEVTAPPPPVLIDVSARDGGLLVRWRKAAGADGYALLVGTSAGNYADPVDVGDVSEYVVGGLQNGVRYYVAAKSYAEGGYMFSVICTANGTRSYPSNPATAVLERVESGASDELPGTPAELRGWPPLEDNGYGCFIGAAAAPSFSGAAAATAAAAAAFLLAAGRAFWRKWGRILALLILILVGHSAIAATREPRLAFGLVGGAFLPRESGWADNYDDDILPTGRASFGLRLTRFLEVGLGGGYWQAKGSVAVDESGAPLAVPADQTLTVVPTHAYLLVDLSLSTDQLLVPYLAGGYSRYFYRRKVDGGDTVRGHLSGYHGRGGVKLLLNRIDPASASVAQVTFGLQRTYWLVEGEYDRIDDFGDSSTDLGGWSVLSGFLLEF